MKKLIFLIITICILGALKAENSVTAQAPDKINFKGTEYSLNSNPLEPYFEKFPDKRPESGMVSTALWRGYIAYFKIIDKQLILTDIQIMQMSDEKSRDNYQVKWVSVLEEVFPSKNLIKVDWYTGILILPHGEMVDYVHMGYASTYSNYWLLEIDNGNLNEARAYNNKEFVAFKKRQFEEFKKTDAYKKLYADLKENDTYNDDAFLKSFISDYVINFTTKFLAQ